ncbi:WAT1-related protein [Carex littledalei]|uniref:WAT1-related protein n=1 Tax=Carex littledalei TaxID=544730 RepID=A0A833VJQ7_9POAL|nr:WAT1-related protein [Carex littledalei]
MGGDYAPALAMMTVQVGFAGLNIVSKLAMDSGMSPFVMITYRNIVATVFLAPLAFLLERKTIMELKGKTLFQLFLCSIFGATLNQILYFVGLKYSSPTIACALSNMLPAITFVMAVPFRMETVRIKTVSGQAKVWGTVLCVGGSMLMTFYKGSLIKLWGPHIHWRYASTSAAATSASTGGSHHMVLGAVLVIASCFAWAIWFIIQAKMCRSFASPYTSSTLLCFMAGMQCLVISFAVERKWSVWVLGWDIRLVAVLYIGVVGSGLAFALMSWCIQRRGPLFVSMFSPLLLVIVAILGWGILDEKLFLGSAVGSALIVGGLYLVLWGKGREMEMDANAVVPMVPDEFISSTGLPVFFSPTEEH